MKKRISDIFKRSYHSYLSIDDLEYYEIDCDAFVNIDEQFFKKQHPKAINSYGFQITPKPTNNSLVSIKLENKESLIEEIEEIKLLKEII